MLILKSIVWNVTFLFWRHIAEFIDKLTMFCLYNIKTWTDHHFLWYLQECELLHSPLKDKNNIWKFIFHLLKSHASYYLAEANWSHRTYEPSKGRCSQCDQMSKSTPNVSKNCPKTSQSSWKLELMLFKIALIVSIQLGYFSRIICHQGTFKNRPIWSHWM